MFIFNKKEMHQLLVIIIIEQQQHQGDLLYLKHIGDGTTSGMLIGDGAFDRVGVQHQGESHADAINFNTYVFCVVPMLAYRQRNGLQALIIGEGRAGSLASVDDENDTDRLTRQRVEAEEISNRNCLQKLKRGSDKEALKYGGVFQLLVSVYGSCSSMF